MHFPTRLIHPLSARAPSAFKIAVLALATTALAPSASAQSVTDFRLPAGSAPRAQGPVDPDNPATPSAPRAPEPPAPAPPAPVPSAIPTLSIRPPAAATPAQPPRPAARAPARPGTAATPQPATAAPAIPAPPTPPEAATGNAAESLPAAPPSATQPAAQPSGSIPWWWLIPAALVGGLGAWALLRRRRAPAPPAFVRPSAPAPTPAPEPAQTPAPTPPPHLADPLAMDLQPVRLSVTLVNATLQYRLILANHSAEPLGPLFIAADMIAAHASLSQQSQLGQDGEGLELRHEIATIAPGESLELKGELRLPLASVTPIKAGAATLLVPLVRLRAEGAGPSRTVALVIGESPVTPGGPLRPFRLDQGPRIFATVGQRALAAAA